VLAPEHRLVPIITTPDRREEVRAYVNQARQKTELDRTADAKLKTGVFTGAYAINPVNRKRVPIWVADYVLISYGTGSIMAVPAHDTRDLEFAQKFHLDVVQVVLVVSVLLADAVALWAIAARITEFGLTPNRVAALGENVILLVNLAWPAVLYVRFLRGRGSFSRLERWQTDYAPVYAAWAAIVVIVFPPLFGYV
jgi:hypothetical protein